MVIEITFELEFTRIYSSSQSSLFLLQYNFHFKTKTSCYFAVVFVCTVQCFTKIFFRSNKSLSPNLKMAFCGSNFSSKLVLKYVK